MSRIFEIRGSTGVRRHTEHDLPLAVGCGGQAQVILAAGGEVEAHLALSRGYLFLQPAPGGLPVLHNNRVIDSSAWIKSGDLVRIGDSLLRFYLSGDLVEIRVSDAAGTGDNGPDPPAPAVPPPREHLPGVGPGVPPPRRRWLWALTALLFLLLLLSAVFVLTARTVEIDIRPAPDTLAVRGFPPLLRLGDRFVGLAGTYRLHAARDGYLDLETTVTVTAQGRSRFAFTLEKKPGIIQIVTSPAGATVRIDDRPAGVTPLEGLELAAGQHHVTLRLARYLDLEQDVNVEGLGRRQRFSFTLAPGWGEVHLVSDPPGAVVLAGGEEAGRTPCTLELMAGHHELLLRRPGFSDGSLAIEVTPGGRHRPPPVELVPSPARVAFSSNPAGAALTADRVFLGSTPLSATVAPGREHEFHFRLAGYRPLTIRRSFEPGSDNRLAVTLEAQYGTVFLSSEPPDAELLVDGRPHGPATGRLRLTATGHLLTVRARGYRAETRKVSPLPGTPLHVDIRLEREGDGHIGADTAAAGPGGRGQGPEMIVLGPARFRMGASRREPGRRANEQQRDVELRRPFALALRTVTNGEFRRFRPGHHSGTVAGHSLDTENQPVVNVSWDDAARYCNWLSDRQGLSRFYRERSGHMVAVSPVTGGYRLPTEAEWAYAARVAGGGHSARYPWPGAFPPRIKAGNFADESARGLLSVVISGYNDGYGVTAPVASFPANGAGFFDLGGNVAQWCHDFYTPTPGLGMAVRAVDPMGPASGSHHVVRGSGWRDATITELRLSYRGYSRKGRDDLGFRVARYLEAQGGPQERTRQR